MTRRSGFTVLELLIAMIIGGILMSIAIAAFGMVQSRLASETGVRTFQSMLARARAQAIETGQTTELWIDTPGDSVWIVRNGDTLERIAFDVEMGVEITGSPSFYKLCMTSRGFADTDCNTFSNVATVIFSQGATADTVFLLPAGQLIQP